MYKLKLIKGLSYTGRGLSVTEAKPITEVKDEATALKAEASGYFEITERPVDDGQGGKGDGNEQKPLNKMTTAELTAYAEERGISVQGMI